MMLHDWLPHREQDFANVCANWKVVMKDPVKIAAYGWEQAEVTAVLGGLDGFLDARSAYKAVNSTVRRAAKDEAREKCGAAMRGFANAFIRFNKKMDDAAKSQMGIFPRDPTRTHHPAPTVRPDIVVENTHNRFEHKVRALNPETGRASKPAGVHGVRYGRQVGGERPASGDALPKSHFSRKTSRVISYTEADKGKTAYYAVCYENSAGDEGKWSPVKEAVIG